MSALRALGHDVRSVSFQRKNMNTGFQPDWPNLDLGHMPNERFVLRLFLLLRALPTVLFNRQFCDRADVIIARNVDLLALAVVFRAARGWRIPLVYECLDIHSALIGKRFFNRVMRWLERVLMKRIQLLWTSSPGFLRNYFLPIQKYDGPVEVLENKIWFENAQSERPAKARRTGRRGPLVLGWVGSIRCQRSLEILCETARQMPDSLEIEVHGIIHHHAISDFEAKIADLANMTFQGPYSYPDGLAKVYARCDLVWAQDLWQRGGNSDWLLPNRIYEASWYGCPCVAVADTQTGRWISDNGIGATINKPTADDLLAYVQSVDRSVLNDLSSSVLSMNDDIFRLSKADMQRALAPVLPH
ncbi:MAG: glycosyltransferase [Paracoccaceae bacterium]